MEERNSREDLSALMDGELGADTARFLLRRMERDPELARAWSRWHLIRACLAERAPDSTHADPLRITGRSDDDAFAARVLGSLRAQQPRRHWARYIGGGAIAASVAAAALMLSVPQATSTDDIAAGGSKHSARATAAATPVAPLASRIAATPVNRINPAPWLDRQSMFLAARPASPGSALPGSYLQQAAYAPDSAGMSAPMLMRDPQQRFNGAPYMILLVPDQDARNAQPQATQQH